MCDSSELSCQNVYNGSQWGVYDIPMLEIGDFFEINTDLRLDPNSVPYPVDTYVIYQGFFFFFQKLIT